jgi:deoxyribodipyrimidine photo-lyase
MTARPRVVLFHRDLRLHDHPALTAACASAREVVPLFVIDPRVPAGPNRRVFLRASLLDLRRSLRDRGADLVLRRGDPVAEAVRIATSIGASGIDTTADVSAYATARQRRLAAACEAARLALRLHPGLTVVPPGELRPAGGGYYQIFTPYWRAWQRHRWRDECPTPPRIALPGGVDPGDAADLDAYASGPGATPAAPGGTGATPAAPGGTAPDLVEPGETAGLHRLGGWVGTAGEYDAVRDDLAADRTSRLSAYLHFGCVSPRTVADDCAGHPAFLRQLCWRDFYHQVLAGFPALPRAALRPRAADTWREDSDALAAWQSGHTGMPIVDAGMRQLIHQGFLHNRARLITAGYLIRTLGLDWRAGAAWYADQLVDADVANNNGNWQWVAGTGNDARPYRGFNPLRQARRFDPDGAYVRRWVPELAGVDGPAVHTPWLLPTDVRQRLPYPSPIAAVPERG